MRELLAAGIFFLVISLGWNQSFESQWQHVRGQLITDPAKRAPRTAAPAAPQPATAAPTPADRSWIFKSTKLDPPPGR